MHRDIASLIAQLVKNLPAMQETQVRFLGREDPLEKEMAIHSSILAWKIPGRGAWRATVHGIARVGHDLATKPSPSFLANSLFQRFILERCHRGLLVGDKRGPHSCIFAV